MSLKLFFALLIAAALFINIKVLLLPTLDEINFIKNHFNYSYDQKMLHILGSEYGYISYVVKNTPTNATIITPPPQPPWGNLGSDTYLKYFLWPRKLLRGHLGDSHFPKEADYALLVWYSKDSSPSAELDWPIIDIEKYNVKIISGSDPKLGLVKLK